MLPVASLSFLISLRIGCSIALRLVILLMFSVFLVSGIFERDLQEMPQVR